MKNNAIIRIVLWSTVIILLIAILCGLLCGVGYTGWRTEISHKAIEETAVAIPLTTAPAEIVAVTGETNIYDAPHTGSNLLGILSPGSDVEISRQETVAGQEWAYITSPVAGWVLMKNISSYRVITGPGPFSATASRALKVYSTPSTESGTVGSVKAGQLITVTRQETINGTDWAYITSPVQGWVHASGFSPVDTTESALQETEEVYSQTEKANTFDASGISELEIEWVAGNILIQPGTSDKITVSEDGSSDTKYDMAVKKRGSKLSILFCEDSTLGLSSLKKDLTITVPVDWECQSLEIDAASSNVTVNDLTIQEVELDTASGACAFNTCTVEELDVDTASGDIQFVGNLDILSCDAASASVYAVLSNIPSRLDMDTMSGDLDITIPEDAGFTITMDTMSSEFSSDFDTTVKNGKQVCGDGRCRINISAMSGDVAIRKGESDAVSTIPEAPTAPDAPTAP